MAYTPHWFITSLAAHAVATYFYFLHANACDFRFCMFYMADVKFFFHDLIIRLFKLLFTFINSLAQFFHWSNKGGGAIGFLSIPTWSAFGNRNEFHFQFNVSIGESYNSIRIAYSLQVGKNNESIGIFSNQFEIKILKYGCFLWSDINWSRKQVYSPNYCIFSHI